MFLTEIYFVMVKNLIGTHFFVSNCNNFVAKTQTLSYEQYFKSPKNSGIVNRNLLHGMTFQPRYGATEEELEL